MRLSLAVTAVALLGLATILTAATPAEEEAAKIGEKWLTLLDGQKFDESWKQAGTTFRDQVMQEQWVAALKRAREPLGTVVTRTAARVDFTKTLRGAPDGEYSIIHYTTAFSNKNPVTERLTLEKENGKWEVSAYAIH